MTVEETKQGLRVMTVYDGSPAEEGGLKPGDVVVAVNGALDRRQPPPRPRRPASRARPGHGDARP